jgi:urease alpha subunit
MKRLFLILLLLAQSAFAVDPTPPIPFRPTGAGTATISCGAASSATALPVSVASVDNAGVLSAQMEVQNAGTVAVFIEPGTTSGITAVVASGYPVLAGQSKVITLGISVTHIACISGSGTQTVYISVGRGY